MKYADWSGYFCEIADVVEDSDHRDHMVELARDFEDTRNPVAALYLLRYSLHYDTPIPESVRDAFVAGIDSYFADAEGRYPLDRHLGLSKPGR